MKKIISTIALVTLVLSCSTQSKTTSNSTSNALKKSDQMADNSPWSERMTLSEIKRFPDPTLLDFTPKPRWSYTNGLVLDAMYNVYQNTQDKSIYNYIYDYANKMISQTGKIDTYNYHSFNLDMVKSGDVIYDLYENTKEKRFKIALDSLELQLVNQPTTTEGGYWHKKIYPNQMWLDGVYMAEPFHALYANKFLETKSADKVFDKIVLQFDLIEKYNRDSKTGLYYHGWDESKKEKWANPITGLSPNFWSRGMGWYGMAMVDVLDFLPENHPGKIKIIKYLNQYVEAIVKIQDKSGVWYQVLNLPNKEGNYLEATGSVMFTYTLLKAVRKGYISKDYFVNAKKAYQGVLTQFIRVDADGLVNLTKCCSVAGLGGNPYRDGTFEYYINEPVRDNDPKGTGPFILASLEYEKLNKK